MIKTHRKLKSSRKNILNTKYKFIQEPRRARVCSACENAKIGKFKNSK